MKNRIRLTESQLHRVIKESVRKVIKEANESIYEPRYASLDGQEITSDSLSDGPDYAKIADKGDYISAYIDYLKEGWDNPADAPSFNRFIEMIRNKEIRYVETNNGIFWDNNWC